MSRPRRNTYVIDKVTEDRQQSLSHTLHEGGIKALLDKANIVFPPEIKAYIVSHFRMIREENLRLNQGLEKANSQLGQYKSQDKELQTTSDQLKAVKGQLEREKAKNKAMMKKIHEQDAEKSDVIWMIQDQKTDQNKNVINSKAEPQRPTTSESRPGTAALNSSSSAKDPSERQRIKVLNKTIKSLRVDISNLQKDNHNMKQVTLK